MSQRDITRRITALERLVEYLTGQSGLARYRGTSASDFTTTTLPQHGDYGFQTVDNELQMNCNGTIRATAMSAL
jgi:hypothetical protein